MSEIRKLASRFLNEASEGESAYLNRDGHCVLTEQEVDRIVIAAMREAYKRAAVTCLSAELFEGNFLKNSDARVTCAEAVRAEAAKLEGQQMADNITADLHKHLQDAESELSRLRDLVREMREALVSISDIDPGNTFSCQSGMARMALAKAAAILKESGEPVKYGCHKDSDAGRITRECAIDSGLPLCILGRHLPMKEACYYWRPIK